MNILTTAQLVELFHDNFNVCRLCSEILSKVRELDKRTYIIEKFNAAFSSVEIAEIVEMWTNENP